MKKSIIIIAPALTRTVKWSNEEKTWQTILYPVT